MSIKSDLKEYSFKLIAHKDLGFFNLIRIIRLKQEYWKYNSIDQYRWIKKNLSKFDKHLLMYLENKIIGYLTIQVGVVDDSKDLFYGIGSVIIKNDFRNKGYSRFLMNESIRFIEETKGIAILLCKEHLINFYREIGFSKYKGIIEFKRSKIIKNLMILPNSNQKMIKLNKLF